MESLSQALFVHPVVLDTRLNILQVYLFTELLHFLKLIFAEYAQKCSGSHVEKLTIGKGRYTQLTRHVLCLIMFALNFEQAYLHKFL